MPTAVILAGGKSRRMGRDKLSLTLSGSTLLQAAASRFSEKFENVYLSVADINKYRDYGYKCIEDVYKDCGPISGLHACLARLDCEGIFLTAADLPYSSPVAALKIMELGKSFDAAVVTGLSGRPEPLFAYYSRSVLAEAEKLIAQGTYKMSVLLKNVNTRVVLREELGSLWDEKILMNINYPEDYERLKSSFSP